MSVKRRAERTPAPREYIKQPEWVADAACRGLSTDMWYPSRAEEAGLARFVCGECDVRYECLVMALRGNEEMGLWGGASERSRRIMRRYIRAGASIEAVAAAAAANPDLAGDRLNRLMAAELGKKVITVPSDYITKAGA